MGGPVIAAITTLEQHAASVVGKYQVVHDPDSAPHHAADSVIPLLKQWGNQYLQDLTLSGAYAKNTAISLSSHVDILISLSPIPGKEMKAVFWNFFEFLTNNHLRPRTRNVSTQIQHNDFNLGLIPACRDKGNGGYMLYNKKTSTPLHTDVPRHIHLVGNSGRTREICALKVWRERHEIEFPSFYLELTAIHALEGQRFSQLADNLLTVFHYLAGGFVQAVVRDPANHDNVVSDNLTGEEKKMIAKAAHSALYDENWKKYLW